VLDVVFWLAVVLVALPAYLAATALASAAMNHGVSRVHLGEATTIRSAYKSVWRRGWRYIGLYLVQGLLIWIVPFAVWMGLLFGVALMAGVMKAAGVGGAAFGALLGLGAVVVVAALTGYGIWMLLKLSLAFPACVVEQVGVWLAVKRSFALGQGTKGRIFLLYLLVAALGWLLSIGVTLPLTLLIYLIPGMSRPQHAQAATVVMMLVIYGAAFAVQALVRPVYGIALVLFYYDQRIRLEGFDIEWLMLQAGMTPAPPAVSEPLVQGVPLAQAEEFPQLAQPASATPGENL
jgi:hypothetical protein